MINHAVAAVVGVSLILLLIAGLSRLKPASGDVVIQPEGEPDPGQHDGAGRSDTVKT